MTQGDLTHRDAAAERDRVDPLSAFPSQFYIADPDVCYLDGNSLGRVPLATMQRMTEFLTDEWGTELVDGWSHWIDEAERAGDRLAKAALGTGPGQTLVADTTSVNLYQLLDAVVASRPGKSTIVVDSANFPTDRYVVHGIAKNRGLEVVTLDVDGSGGPGAVAVDTESDRLTPELVEPFLTDDVAVMTLQVVNYRSGARQDVTAINALAKKKGIPVVWDCAHAVGSVVLDFDRTGVDLAVGCTYKYLNAGPGAPAWLFVRNSLQESLHVPIQGWFAQGDQFTMGPFFDRASSIRGFQIASPNIMGIRCVQESLSMVEQAGMEAIEQKARLGTDMMVALYEAWLEPLGFRLGTPRDASQRGAHVMLSHPEAKAIAAALRSLNKVIPDYREPSSIRMAFSPLANSFVEVWEGMHRMKELVESGRYQEVSGSDSRVT